MFSYSQKFYEEMKDTNLASARAVVPLVMNLVEPTSVVDIGCGTGVWLKAFGENGVKNIAGIDGDWVKPEMLVIPPHVFRVDNLERGVQVGQTYDLAVCLEVAEHLPGTAAEKLVDSLVQAAPVVLFSAAIPFQGGSHHINEQWPSYWEEFFNKKGYVAVDCIRRFVWQHKDVSFFYAQNIFLYVKKSEVERYPKLQEFIHINGVGATSLVHPFMYLYYAERWRLLVPFLGKIPPSILHSTKKFLRTFMGSRKK